VKESHRNAGPANIKCFVLAWLAGRAWICPCSTCPGGEKITNVQCKYNTRKRQKGPWHVTGEAPFAKGEEEKAKVYQQLEKNKNWQRSVRGRTDVLKRREEDT
jgi:hypothetical protein